MHFKSPRGVVRAGDGVSVSVHRGKVLGIVGESGSLMRDPRVLICDEPVSALDVSVQAQILNLLEDMKARDGLTLVFIAHDLAVVKNISDRVAVMYLGKLCEVAGADEVYRAPRHPYTAALLRSIPVPDPLRRPDAVASALTANCRHRSTRRADAASGPAAPGPRSAAQKRNRRWSS